jgi:hypothetical protein
LPGTAIKTQTPFSTSPGQTAPTKPPSMTKEPTNTKTKKPTKTALRLDTTGSVLAATGTYGFLENPNQNILVSAPLDSILRHISPEWIIIGVIIIAIIIIGGIIYYYAGKNKF